MPLFYELLLLFFCIATILKMSDRPQRSLRPRKPYPYLPPDTQDPDQIRYPRLNYNKEMVSPAMELNSNAKILVKFFNAANKTLRQSRRIEESDNQFIARHDPPPVDKYAQRNKNVTQTGRKVDTIKKTQKEDQNKKEKQLNNLKTYSSHLNINRGLIRNEQPNRFTDPRVSQHQNLLFQNGDPILAQIIPSMYDSKIFSNLQHSQNPLEAAQKARAQQNFFFNNTQMYQNRNKQPEQPSKNVQQQQLKDKENKLFGRSAYHVAIAYHIHLKKLKEHGDIIKNSEAIDPTYNARRLKGDKVNPRTGMDEEK